VRDPTVCAHTSGLLKIPGKKEKKSLGGSARHSPGFNFARASGEGGDAAGPRGRPFPRVPAAAIGLPGPSQEVWGERRRSF